MSTAPATYAHDVENHLARAAMVRKDFPDAVIAYCDLTGDLRPLDRLMELAFDFQSDERYVWRHLTGPQGMGHAEAIAFLVDPQSRPQ